jgi:hypothetical protein
VTTLRLLGCAVLLLSGCKKDAPPPPPAPRVAADGGAAPATAFGIMPRAGEQSYADAWKAFCDAEQQIPGLESLPKEQRKQALAVWVHDHVRNQEFVFFLAEMQGTRPDERRRRYQEQLAAAGIAKCALGEKFFPEPPQP